MNLHDTLNLMCNIHDGIDYRNHFLLHFRQFANIHSDLLHNLSLHFNDIINNMPGNTLLQILLYGKENASHKVKKQILLNTIDFIRRRNGL